MNGRSVLRPVAATEGDTEVIGSTPPGENDRLSSRICRGNLCGLPSPSPSASRDVSLPVIPRCRFHKFIKSLGVELKGGIHGIGAGGLGNLLELALPSLESPRETCSELEESPACPCRLVDLCASLGRRGLPLSGVVGVERSSDESWEGDWGWKLMEVEVEIVPPRCIRPNDASGAGWVGEKRENGRGG